MSGSSVSIVLSISLLPSPLFGRREYRASGDWEGGTDWVGEERCSGPGPFRTAEERGRK